MSILTRLDSERPASKLRERLPRSAAAVLQRLRHEDVLMLAAGLAFYALVSVIPFSMLVLSLVSLVAGDDGVRRASDLLSRLLPSQLGAGGMFERLAGIGADLGIGAVLALLWPASAYGAGLSRAFQRLCPAPDRPAKGLRGRVLTIVLVGVMPALVLGGLVAAYAGTALLGRGPMAAVAGWILVFAFGFLASTVAGVVIYRLFSPRPIRLRGLVSGGATAGACISLLSAAYVVFLRFGTDFEDRYATTGMAAVVLLSLWLFLANALILVGYQTAVQVEERTGGASPLRRRRSIRRRVSGLLS